MGLLDDAIRDHLDLKRRRGADPAEVERAEREALGPVRRNPTAAELSEPDAAEAAEGVAGYDQAGDDSWAHDSLQEPAADAGVESVYDDPPASPPAEFHPSGASPLDGVHDHLGAEHVEDEPESFRESAPSRDAAREPYPARADPPVTGSGPDTAEYDIEDALASEQEHPPRGDDDDVLEETPEFLQDTPDHDRLWFEQRPPRDFDFDE